MTANIEWNGCYIEGSVQVHVAESLVRYCNFISRREKTINNIAILQSVHGAALGAITKYRALLNSAHGSLRVAFTPFYACGWLKMITLRDGVH